MFIIAIRPILKKKRQTPFLISTISFRPDVPIEAALEIFGEFFFDYCLRHGYDKMLRTLGSDIKSFIQNLDSLHSLLALSYKGIAAPSFRYVDLIFTHTHIQVHHLLQ